MALGQTFDLASIYGAAEGLKEQRTRNELLDQQVGMRNLMRDTAKAAVGPDGQYDPFIHAKALSQAGYPKVGQQILGEMMDHAVKADKYLVSMIPRMTPESYPGIKAQMEGAWIIQPGQFPEQFDQKVIMSQYAMLQGLHGKLTGAMEELYRDDAGNTVVGTRNLLTGEPSNIQKFSAPKPDKPRTVKPQEVQFADGSTGFVNPETGEPMLSGMRPVPKSGQGIKMPVGYQNDPDRPGAIMPIPGGPAEKLPGDMAGKASLIDEAARAVTDVRAILFDDSGALRRGRVFKAQTNMPWSTGRQARQHIRVAVEAALRITSGAAVPDSEVERYTDMFTPSIMDDDKTAMQKMDSLTNFVSQAQANIAIGRGQPAAQSPSPTSAAPRSPAANGLPMVSGYDDYHALPSGAQYIDRYGRTRRKR